MNNISIEIYNSISQSLLNSDFLKKFSLSESRIKNQIDDSVFLNNINIMIENKDYSCKSILFFCKNMLDGIHIKLDMEEWLTYIYNVALSKSFPMALDMDITSIPKTLNAACHVYLEILRVFSKFQKASDDFSWQSKYPLNFLTTQEENNLENKLEYKNFIKAFENEYIYEMMKLNQEVLKHSTLDHICGVHYIAMHISKQLHKIGIPIDLGRISGSCAGHDIGKFGCKSSESKRVAYLHYYYTDEWFKKHDITYIGHIALNHSVWDLELENLSLESLILIYSDFRIKNKIETGSAKMHIYTLDESFNVILEKLDNLDEKKTKRYARVYSKLKDFEEYLIYIGINVNIESKNIQNKNIKNKPYYSLIHGDKVVENIKYLAIHHNINLMYKLRHESSLNSILELARSQNDGRNLREYLQVFEEYSTYLTQRQKLITLRFSYEQIIHPEDDIRRQCAELIGILIAAFDEEYRKETPENIVLSQIPITGYTLLDEYLNLFMYPDHKIIDLHQKWIGYSIRIMISSLFSSCNKNQINKFKEIIFKYYNNDSYDDASIFLYLLNTAKYIPLTDDDNDKILFDYIIKMLKSENDNLRISAFDTSLNLIHKINQNSYFIKQITTLLEDETLNTNIRAENFLKLKIAQKLQCRTFTIEHYTRSYYEHETQVSHIFLNNLKTLTPWTIKKTNIDLLLEYTLKNPNNMIYTAIHFCNILKVSAIEYVRNSAGKALIELMPNLPLEQRNDIAVELIRSLEIEGYQFSKYIPYYLGKLILYLEPVELDEILLDFIEKIKYSSSQLNSLLLKTIGITIECYPKYKSRFLEDENLYETRLTKLLGILLNGLAHYNSDIKQVAFRVIGKEIFGSKKLTLEEKRYIFRLIGKKILVLLDSMEENDITFLTNSASLNHMYRFISDYTFLNLNIDIDFPKKIAFFPGTFDPFSLSHKQIAKAIQCLGFEVYLAVDEFSWSKKAQPNLFRRNIINMSVADEPNIYLYPEDIPINIANSNDMNILKENFPNSDIYIVIGSDVILNASAYKKDKFKNSIHTFPHIIFERKSLNCNGDGFKRLKNAMKNLEEKTILLNLPTQYEDISSSQIRDYIDENRDISNLIDPLAQKYIYEKGLYQREPQYKTLMKTASIDIEILEIISDDIIKEVTSQFFEDEPYCLENLLEFSSKIDSKLLIIRDSSNEHKILGFCAFHPILWNMISKEFKSTIVSDYIRQNTMGKTIIIDGLFISLHSKLKNPEQIILTEVLSYCIERDYTYAVYKNSITDYTPNSLQEILRLQGFYKLPYNNERDSISIVNMSSPCILNLDIETIIKDPFIRSYNVKKTILNCRKKLQKSLTDLYPGHLVLSFDREVLYQNLIKKICEENNVSPVPSDPRNLGDLICVPFGNILKGIAIPNTITKSLHTEKLFTPDMDSFTIASYPYYLDLETQVKTIGSFNKPIILVDDILNKGYRIKAIDPILKKQNIDVSKIIVGILSARGKELMDIQNRDVDSVYFIPNLRVWFNENALYPFMGGDTLWRGIYPKRNLLPSVNLIFPYTSPSFLRNASKKSLYNLSLVCIENSIQILEALEKEYEQINQRNLTLNHLGEVFVSPRYPDRGRNINYDLNLNPSHYLRNDLELLSRMQNILYK